MLNFGVLPLRIFAGGFEIGFTIVVAAVCVVAFVINKIAVRRRKRQEKEKLREYSQKRSRYYWQERRKVLAYYRERIVSGALPADEALKEVKFWLQANGEGENGWLNEYLEFAAEMKKYRR